MSRPTPETDFAMSVGLENADRECVPADFARKLERERNEWAAMCGRYKQERDEAREKLDEEMKWHHRTHTELVQTQCKILDMHMGRDEIQEKYDNLATEHMLVVNKLCEERDEAREEHRKLKIILDIIKRETL
jgi:uncharacterized coiled-coil DUF342 family protein